MTTDRIEPLKFEVYDPPMCCSSGICGAAVDQDLVCFATSLEWLRMKGAQVERFNPSHQYDAFARNPVVVKTVNEKGTDCLPLIVLNGKIVSSGRYPDRRELAAWAELSEPTHHGSSQDDESPCCGTECCG